MARVLVIDDEDAVLTLVKRSLSRKGFEVEVTDKARGAAEVAARFEPDLIVLDVSMPEMDGYEVASLLAGRDLTRSIPIVFYSSLDETRLLRIASRVAGARAVCKAAGVNKLRDVVLEVLGDPTAG